MSILYSSSPRSGFRRAVRTRRRAFTLVELLVVIAIIGLLSTVAVISLAGARSKARDAKRLADKTQIIKALQMYYDSNGGWPWSGGSWRCFGAPTAEPCWKGTYSGLDSLITAMSPYMTIFPKSETDSGNNAYNRYLYHSNGDIGYPGAFLIWYKENPMVQSECPSPHPVQHYDKYWYCYESLGT
jgi:prepilin-type N-terminal cleavage/methylation domain-containing protein